MSGYIRRKLFFFKDRLKGSPISFHIQELNTINCDYQKGMILQKELIEELLTHFTQNSKFYYPYKDCSLNEFPIMDKNILNHNYDKLVVDKTCLTFQKGEMHIHRTSGSTGAPLIIPQDSRKRNRRIAELKYFGETVGFKSHETLCQCRIWTKWHGKTRWQSFKENIIAFNISSMNELTIQNLLNIIESRRVLFIRAYASWYDSLLDYLLTNVEEQKKIKTLKLGFSSSEALSSTTKEIFKSKFNIDLVEAYANEEGGIIGHQKIGDSNFYLNHASFFIELLKLDSNEPAAYGELGRIVITDLYNYAFPLIRYDTGDTGVMEEGILESSGWPYLKYLYGRKVDIIYDTNGDPIHPMNFARILKNVDGINQWQFIQKSKDTYLVKLNLKYTIDFDPIRAAIQELVKPDGIVNFQIVEDIPVLASGKRKSVICELNKKK
ncbi:MAG: hypothetical protein PQJ45_02475 [Sphaerochaetaceae bacterium]|nr:hypothetical protein [Sphaerochaetaceae bacterium]